MKNKLFGFVRSDGKVGFRNHVLILPTVICSERVATKISSAVSGTVVAAHHQGCAQLGSDFHQTLRTLVNTALNPNVGAVLVVGLGCERVSPREVVAEIEKAGKPVELIMIQDLGVVESVGKGIKFAKNMVDIIGKQKRELVPESSIVVGLECGGSDFSSGLSANPVVGEISDRVFKSGGKSILSETTELVGAEHLLFERMKDQHMKDTFRRMLKRMIDESVNNSRDMVDKENVPNNISPGNVRGGLTTLEEKSLGAMSKGGKCPIVGVLEYAELCGSSRGLYLMDTPGYDVESVTGMVAGGANIVLFTTGLGTPTGNPIVPVIKVTGNYETAERLKDMIDFDSSPVICHGKTIKEMGNELFEMLIKVANGKETKAETLGQDDYSIWTVGIKL